MIPIAINKPQDCFVVLDGLPKDFDNLPLTKKANFILHQWEVRIDQALLVLDSQYDIEEKAIRNSNEKLVLSFLSNNLMHNAEEITEAEKTLIEYMIKIAKMVSDRISQIEEMNIDRIIMKELVKMLMKTWKEMNTCIKKMISDKSGEIL